MDTTIVTTEPPQEPTLPEPVIAPKKSARWVPIAVILSATAALIAGAVILLLAHGGSAQWSDQRVADTINQSLNSDPTAAPGAAPPAQYRASDIPALLAAYWPVLNDEQAMLAKVAPDGDGGPETDQVTLQTSGRCQGTRS